MGYLEEQLQSLSINIRNNFPELRKEIQSINRNIEIVNLLKTIELNDKINFLSQKEYLTILNKLKQELNENYISENNKKIKKF